MNGPAWASTSSTPLPANSSSEPAKRARRPKPSRKFETWVASSPWPTPSQPGTKPPKSGHRCPGWRGRRTKDQMARRYPQHRGAARLGPSLFLLTDTTTTKGNFSHTIDSQDHTLQPTSPHHSPHHRRPSATLQPGNLPTHRRRNRATRDAHNAFLYDTGATNRVLQLGGTVATHMVGCRHDFAAEAANHNMWPMTQPSHMSSDPFSVVFDGGSLMRGSDASWRCQRQRQTDRRTESHKQVHTSIWTCTCDVQHTTNSVQ